MGKKYIIELPENTHWIQWLMEGTEDHHPYMDFKSVEDLMPYTEPDLEQVRKEAYQRGFKDGQYAERNGLVANYEQERETIQVGDEVRNIKGGWIAVVSNIDGECMTLMDINGALGDGYDVNRFTKTGRTFPEIAEILQKMKEEA